MEALQAKEDSIQVNRISTSVTWPAMINSLLTTALLAIDRYIAVKYSLRYESIMTKTKLFVALGITWAISVVIAGIQLINTSNYIDYNVRVFITLTALHIFVGTLLISISKYANVVRNRHLNAIKKRNILELQKKKKIDLKESETP